MKVIFQTFENFTFWIIVDGWLETSVRDVQSKTYKVKVDETI